MAMYGKAALLKEQKRKEEMKKLGAQIEQQQL